MERESIFNFFLICIGLLSVLAAFINWGWLFKKHQGMGLVSLLEQKGVRVFNFMLGILALIIGAFDYVFPLIK